MAFGGNQLGHMSHFAGFFKLDGNLFLNQKNHAYDSAEESVHYIQENQ